MYTLDSIITVVDAKAVKLALTVYCSEGVENEYVEQVCFADKILLNKIDLSDEAKLTKIEAELRKLNPTTTILRCQHSKISLISTPRVSPKELLNIGGFELKRVLDFDPEFLDEYAEHEHDSTVSSVLISF
ncbi:hypothetical protein ACHAXR_000298, partial [Thalassiosira sp. AJA248-18]